MRLQTLALMLSLAALTTPALAEKHAHEHEHAHKHAGHAHVHGAARLEVAVEGAELHIRLESPLDNLLGFEHAPRTDQERAAVAALRKALADPARLFAPTAAAACVAAPPVVSAPVLEAPAKGKAAGEAAKQHADLDAEFRFTCAQPARLTGLAVNLADAFPGLQRIDAEVVSDKGQKAARLSAKMRFLSW